METARASLREVRFETFAGALFARRILRLIRVIRADGGAAIQMRV